MQIIFPFSKTVDLVYAIIGTLIFSGYIVYDTYLINKRLSPDEYIIGALSLYLEYVSIPAPPLDFLLPDADGCFHFCAALFPVALSISVSVSCGLLVVLD